MAKKQTQTNANCVYLPTDEDTKLTVKISENESIEFELLDFDDCVATANEKANKSGDTVWEELAGILKQKYKKEFTTNQCRWLYLTVRDRINAIKKKL
jgi:hypothetical protein